MYKKQIDSRCIGRVFSGKKFDVGVVHQLSLMVDRRDGGSSVVAVINYSMQTALQDWVDPV